LNIGALIFAANPAYAAGPQVYASRCSMCHQTTGAGLPGSFPRLSGRVSQIAASPDGRAYLVRVLLFGMYGSVTIDGKSINGLMPNMASMADQDMADVLNHVVSLKKVGKPAAFTAAEVAKVRAGPKATTSAMAAERARLVAKGGFP
jgi:mono/diheme cytochrome c family protein